MNTKYIALALCGVLMNSTALLIIKSGTKRLSTINFNYILKSDYFFKVIKDVFFNINIIVGIFFYFLGTVITIMVLSRSNVSILAPLGSVGFVFIAIMAYFVYGEPLTYNKMIGIALIIIGVITISYSKG